MMETLNKMKDKLERESKERQLAGRQVEELRAEVLQLRTVPPHTCNRHVPGPGLVRPDTRLEESVHLSEEEILSPALLSDLQCSRRTSSVHRWFGSLSIHLHLSSCSSSCASSPTSTSSSRRSTSLWRGSACTSSSSRSSWRNWTEEEERPSALQPAEVLQLEQTS